MSEMRIVDEAVVIRGGRNRSEDLSRAVALHPSGVTGVSVHVAAGLPLKVLAVGIPHGQVGVTSVQDIRNAGGDVIRTSGRSPHHGTLTGLDAETLSRLLTPTQKNPALGETL